MEKSTQKIAVYPGSFDPITLGHESVIRRAMPLFDKIIVAIGQNNDKRNLFPIEKRIQWIKAIFKDEPKIEVQTYKGLTVNYCNEIGANFLLRGLRTSADFEFERSVGQINKKMGHIDTIFILAEPEYTPLQSSIVRDIFIHGGDVSSFISNKIDLKL